MEGLSSAVADTVRATDLLHGAHGRERFRNIVGNVESNFALQKKKAFSRS